MSPAPELLVHGAVHTLDPARPRAEAVLVRDGRIASVGSLDACARLAGADLRLVRAGSVVPGLSDAHGHVQWLGRAHLEVSLAGEQSEEACAARVVERARETPRGAWLRGRGWDQNRWAGARFPTSASLSRAVPDHPVVLTRVDGHSCWVNAAALAAAGIGASTPDPPGGAIRRDTAGLPTGVLVDAAMDLVLRKIPPPGDADVERALVSGMRELVALGLTSVHDAGVAPDVLDVYRRLAAADRLPLRVYAMIDGGPPVPALEAELARWRASPEIGRLTVRAVKLFADGALGSRGAALHEDYTDDRGNRGLLLTPPDVLRAKVQAVVAAGLQPAIHAIGDRATSEVLDALAGAADGERLRRARPRIEHLQLVRPGDLPRLVATGAIASMQPVHATSDGPWIAARLGEGTERLRGAYAWRTMLRHGVPLAFGSDFPVEHPDPRAGLHAAETRLPAGAAAPFAPEERVSRDEALRAFTSGAAYAALAEGRRGIIREGLDADLTVFAADVMAVPAAELLAIEVTHTIVGGRVEWER